MVDVTGDGDGGDSSPEQDVRDDPDGSTRESDRSHRTTNGTDAGPLSKVGDRRVVVAGAVAVLVVAAVLFGVASPPGSSPSAGPETPGTGPGTTPTAATTPTVTATPGTPGPGTTSPGTPEPGTTTSASGGGSVPARANSSYELRSVAARRLAEAGRAGLAQRVRNASAAYATGNHTRSAPFEADAAVVRQAGSGATSALVAADARLARAALGDARRARSLLDRYGTSYDRSAVGSLLSEASRALERGRRLRSTDPVGAVDQFQSAWRRAQRAIDRMDRAFRPRVRLFDRSDPIGGLGTNRTLSGAVVDVRTDDLSAIAVVVDGRRRTVGVDGTTVPLSRARFGLRVSLPADPTRVRLTPVEASGPANGSTTVRFDGDGLTDSFERNKSRDPLDPDSDGDGTVDGRENYTTSTRADLNESDGVSVRVQVTARGNAAAGVTVRRDGRETVRSPAVDSVRAAPVYRIESDRPVERATIRFEYDGRSVGNESSLKAYKFREQWGTYRPTLVSNVRPGADAVVATTTGFSTFTVMNADGWQKAFANAGGGGRESANGTGGDGDAAVDDVVEGNYSYSFANDFENGTETWFVDRKGTEFVAAGFGNQSTSLATNVGGQYCCSKSEPLGVNSSEFTLRGRINATGDGTPTVGIISNRRAPGPHQSILIAGFNESDDGTPGGGGPDSGGRDESRKGLRDGTGVWELIVANPGSGDGVNETVSVTLGAAETSRWYEFELVGDVVDGTPTVAAKVWPAGQPEPDEYDATVRSDHVDFENGRIWFVDGTSVLGAPNHGVYLDYYNVTSVGALPDVDGDGLESSDELSGFPTGVGRTVVTDPRDNDTDDDGATDDREIGVERPSPYGGGTFYRTVSDPTDPRSDDHGLMDGRELQVGSDPREAETQMVYAKLPTFSDPDGTPTRLDNDQIGEGTYLAAADLFRSDDSLATLLPPNWLTGVVGDGEEIPDDKTFVLVDVPVFVGVENASEDVVHVEFEFTGSATVWKSGYRPKAAGGDAFRFSDGGTGTPVEEGFNVVSLVVMVDEKISPAGDGNAVADSYKVLGNLQMTIVRGNDDVFNRPRDPAYAPVEGYNRTTITSKRQFLVRNYGSDETVGMYRAGVKNIESAAVAAVGLEIGYVGPTVEAGAQVAVLHGSSVVARALLTVEVAKVLCSVAKSDAEILKLCPSIGGRPRDRDTEGPAVGEGGNVSVPPRIETLRLTDAHLGDEVYHKTMTIGLLEYPREYVYTVVGMVRRN